MTQTDTLTNFEQKLKQFSNNYVEQGTAGKMWIIGYLEGLLIESAHTAILRGNAEDVERMTRNLKLPQEL